MRIRMPSERIHLTDAELAEEGRTREEHEAFERMVEEGESEDPRPGDPEFNPHVPPFLVVTGASMNGRFLYDPDQGVQGFSTNSGHTRVFKLRDEDVEAMSQMAYPERLAYVQNIDLERLVMVKEHGARVEPFSPYQLPLFKD